MSYKPHRPWLNLMSFYFMICLFYIIKQQKKKGFFFSASPIFKLAAAALWWKVEGLGEEQHRELRGCNNRSGNKSSGGAGVVVVGGVCGRAASQTHISLFSSEVYTTILPKPFSAVKSGVRLR